MPGLYLQMVKGTTRDGKVLRLPGERFVIGRSRRCKIRLRSDATSRFHAILRLTEGGWVVEDQASSNGTWLRGKRIEVAALRPMDLISFGEGAARIRVVSLDPAPAIDASSEAPTRYVEFQRGRRPRAPKVRRVPPAPKESEAPPEPAIPAAAATPAVPTLLETRPRSHLPLLTLVGLVFGILIAWQLLGGRFPYAEAASPILWALHGLRSVAPEVVAKAGDYLLRFGICLWFAGLGFALQRPLSRLPVIVGFGLLQVGAIMALYGHL